MLHLSHLSDSEINYYVEHYKPLDKAGAYGIQEWIGYIGVTSIKGSYFNVMGLPVQRIYKELQEIFDLPGMIGIYLRILLLISVFLSFLCIKAITLQKNILINGFSRII